MASGKQPITRHPLFPAAVALWFGALFGIGSLAVGQSAIESAITGLKLDAIIAVPISPSTRILIALALTGAGGLLGAWLARRIGRPKPVARPRKRAASFIAGGTEDFADSPADAETAAGARANRRTQLAIPDNGHGEVEYYDRAPVPGTTSILDVSQFGLEGFEPEKVPHANPDSASDLVIEPENQQEAIFLPGPAYDAVPAGFEAPEAPVEPAADEPAASPVLPRLAGEEEPEAPATANAASTAQSLFSRASAPGLFAQPLSARVSEIHWQDTAAQQEEQPAAAPAADTSAADRLASAKLDDLAPIELLERLAISLREKRNRAAMAAAALSAEADPVPQTPIADEAPQSEPDDETEATEEAGDASEWAGAPAAPPVPTVPAALRPIGFDPEDDDEEALPGYIPPRRIGGSAPVPPALPPESGGSAIHSHDPEETERALRSALANIQRMSGTA